MSDITIYCHTAQAETVRDALKSWRATLAQDGHTMRVVAKPAAPGWHKIANKHLSAWTAQQIGSAVRRAVA